MLKSTSRCFGRICIWKFLPKSFARTFLTPTRPIYARSRLQCQEIVEEVNENTMYDFGKVKSRVKGPWHRQMNSYAALESLILSPEDQAPRNLSRSCHRVYSHRTYEGLTRSLIRRSRIADAVRVYERMIREGLIVSLSLEVQMLAIAMSQAENQSKNILLSRFKSVVRKEAFSPGDLFEVLGVMTNLDLPPELLLDIMADFTKTHKFTKPLKFDVRFLQDLANAAVEAGDIQTALDALSALPQSDANETLLSRVYASFIAAIRKSAYPSRDAVSATLNQMKNQGIPPSLFVWNSLIAFEVRASSLHRPFAIFDALKNRSELLPDHNTFGSLFKALNRFYNPKRRKFRHGKPLPDSIPSPRALYREMLGYLVRHPQEPQFRLTTSLLNTILRSFVFMRDYAGAFLILRLFHLRRIPVNVKTYFIVFRHLMNRVTYGIRAARKMGSVTWADRFLGLPFPIYDPIFLSCLQLSNPLASHILDVCKCSSFALDEPLYMSSQPLNDISPAKYQTPTVEGMLDKVAVSLDQEFDGVPLERLMKKALLAEMELLQELPSGRATNSALSEMIASVKQEMVPPDLQKRREKIKEESYLIQLIQLSRIITAGDVSGDV
ncbi:hypothetical protein Ac2012v2_003585 [Leucoagaricus gongylophorus]